MKLRKIALALVIVLVASTFAPVFAKSPFSDVPADHWAYDSIVELAAAGLLEGYPDGTFGGSRMMTRYEGAMVFARALQRLEDKVGIYPELDKIKAQIVEELGSQAGSSGVERVIVEKIVVDSGADGETAARVKANQMAVEALGGDLAYLENRVLGLIDGMRWDVNQLNEADQFNLDEMEELIAARIEEAILEAASSVGETVIIERIVATSNDEGLSEEEVEMIVEELIIEQLQRYDILVTENRDYILDIFYAIDDLEASQAELAAKVDGLDRVSFGGSLASKVTTIDPVTGAFDDIWRFSQAFNLNLNIKASDTVNVKAFTVGSMNTFDADKYKISSYRVEVDSETPVKKLTVGKFNAGIGMDYVLAARTAAAGPYNFAAMADVDVIDNLTAKVLLGKGNGVDGPEAIDAALGLDYSLMDELKFKFAVAGDKAPVGVKPNFEYLGFGVHGKVAGIGYAGNYAMELEDTKKNIFDVSLNAEFGPVKADAKYVGRSAEGYANSGFAADDAKALNSIEAGLGAEFIGIDLGGRFYREGWENDEQFMAFRVDAGYKLGPVALAAEYVGNKENDEDMVSRYAFSADYAGETGALTYGAGASFAQGLYNPWYATWKHNVIVDKKELVVYGDLGYGFDWKGAAVDLGYGLEFVSSLEDGDPNFLGHDLSFGYGFTDNVNLNLGFGVNQTLSSPATVDYSYTAGLTVVF